MQISESLQNPFIEILLLTVSQASFKKKKKEDILKGTA